MIMWDLNDTYKIDRLECSKKLNICTWYKVNYLGKKYKSETVRPYSIKDVSFKMVTKTESCGKHRRCRVEYCEINLVDMQKRETLVYSGRKVQEASCKAKVTNLKKQFIYSGNEFTIDLKKL